MILRSGDYEWEYFKFGNGPEVLFAWHGFDNDADDFRIFENAFGNRYTIIALNLFYHGKSKPLNDGAALNFNSEDLIIFFKKLLEEIKCERFSMLGFSLGGRIILDLLPKFAERIDRILLLAPDGLVISKWYLFITHTYFGKYLFKRVIKKPNRFFRIARFIRATGLLKEKQYKFALANFDTPEKRRKVYNVWMIFRNILPVYPEIKSVLSRHNIQITIFFGKFDTIIPASFADQFRKKTKAEIRVKELNTGHNLMKASLAGEYVQWLDEG
ncbi:MAG: alpha/beta fold hydrolase [Bacteroidetes bacterium]|nr:MAG: alpha/beta fold hydrolase [Bacteroidota bacterium]REK07574.1 MAG: alpha/beta fold hydrolase [Bacteroidota bacterium]REK36993.1 MAG: alpha/beta fold hydrolase [Bacteroidota bacterium]REK47814.1 MAG: alpha/beta fold hydrolase [Bacteroidota bacterium]